MVSLMFNLPASHVCDFTVCCKGCGENIPAPVGTMPDTWIVAACQLCGRKRRYLPSETFRGKLSWRLGGVAKRPGLGGVMPEPGTIAKNS